MIFNQSFDKFKEKIDIVKISQTIEEFNKIITNHEKALLLLKSHANF